MGGKKLTIVSDTAVFCKDNEYYGFGPVVREIEYIDFVFDEITWIGFNSEDKLGDMSMQKITSPKIKVVFLKKVGGKGVLSVLNILFQYPVMLIVILKNIIKADVVHTRAPSHPAVIAVMLSFIFRNKIWWNKYAGDWDQEKTSFSYRFQRWLFKKAKHTKVTINGFWENQLKHCYSFENPCLTKTDIAEGIEIAGEKEFFPPFTFCFVGRVDEVKGVSRILNALSEIPYEQIGKVHIVGEGKDMEKYKKEASFLGEKIFFHGNQSKENVHKYMGESHFFLLPSTAEGFPKVVAEAACYGTIPVVSNVSSVKHYLNDSNSFLWHISTREVYGEILKKAIDSPEEIKIKKSKEIMKIAPLFTFDNYLKKLKENII